jgi:hypothetical protein
MKILQVGGVIVVTAITAVCLAAIGGVIVVTAITAVCLAAMGKKVINIQPSIG